MSNKPKSAVIERVIYRAKFRQRPVHGSTPQNPDATCLKERGDILISDFSATESDGFVFLDGNDFKDIFGKRHADTSLRNKLAIVKITNPRTGMSIHRQFRTSGDLHHLNNYAILTFYSLVNIVKSQEELDRMDKVVLSKGCIYQYYWNHPFHATKVATRIGVYSFLASLLGILLNLLMIVC